MSCCQISQSNCQPGEHLVEWPVLIWCPPSLWWHGSPQDFIRLFLGQGIFHWHWENALHTSRACNACSQCQWNIPWLWAMYDQSWGELWMGGLPCPLIPGIYQGIYLTQYLLVLGMDFFSLLLLCLFLIIIINIRRQAFLCLSSIIVQVVPQKLCAPHEFQEVIWGHRMVPSPLYRCLDAWKVPRYWNARKEWTQWTPSGQANERNERLNVDNVPNS